MKEKQSACTSLIFYIMFVGVACSPAFGSEGMGRQRDRSGDGNFSVTQHTLEIADRSLPYTVTAGFMPLRDDAGNLQARIFFTAYTRDDVDEQTERPVSFAFNGGPGAASIWLHLGGLGPKRVHFPDEGKRMPRNPRLIDNPDTWLTFTDLVFIDPVGTGYSRTAAGVDAQQFYEVEGDIRSIGNFIRWYSTEFARWLSPKYLVGESYGATRAAGLAGHVQDNLGMYLSGVALISPVLDFDTIFFRRDLDIAYVLALPTYAATAWYHGRFGAEGQSLSEVLQEVERWTMTEYLVALAQGDTISETDRSRVARRLAEFTGLSEKYLLLNNLRVPSYQYMNELLRDQGRTVGSMDSRVAGLSVDRASQYARYDPSFFMTIGPLVAAINDYVRRDLEVQVDVPYEYLPREVNRAWDFEYQNVRPTNTAPTLREAMTKNPHLKVFVVCGYYDITTPYFAAVHTVNQMYLDPQIRNNVRFGFYPSGHQIYTHFKVLQALARDAEEFYRQ